MEELHALIRQNTDICRGNAALLRTQNQRFEHLKTESQPTRKVVLQVWELGKRIFSVLVDVQHYFGNSLPPQVKVLEPVCLEDALGRTAPFHVEWVNSREVSF